MSNKKWTNKPNVPFTTLTLVTYDTQHMTLVKKHLIDL